MTISYRYRVVLYHENQRWVRKVAPLIDRSPLLLFMTDSPEAFQAKLEAKEVDIIITGVNTKYFMLKEDHSNSLSFKEAPIWEAVASYRLNCQIILFCSQKEIPLAASLVQDGYIYDYCVVNPLLDKTRPYLSVAKALQERMYRDVIQQRVLQGKSVPKDLLETVDMLQTLRNESQEPEFPPSQAPDLAPISQLSEEEPSVLQSEFIQKDEQEPSPFTPAKPPSSGKQVNQDDSDWSAFPSAFPSFKTEKAEQTVERDDLKSPFTVSEPDLWAPKGRMKKGDFDILLIDNNPDNIELIGRAMERQGYSVLTATSASEGVYYLNKELFEMLIINSDLPDQNGISFLNLIRTRGPQADIPAIIVSERTIGHNILKSIQVGAHHVFAQPVDPDRLAAVVNQLMSRIS